MGQRERERERGERVFLLQDFSSCTADGNMIVFAFAKPRLWGKCSFFSRMQENMLHFFAFYYYHFYIFFLLCFFYDEMSTCRSVKCSVDQARAAASHSFIILLDIGIILTPVWKEIPRRSPRRTSWRCRRDAENSLIQVSHPFSSRVSLDKSNDSRINLEPHEVLLSPIIRSSFRFLHWNSNQKKIIFINSLLNK